MDSKKLIFQNFNNAIFAPHETRLNLKTNPNQQAITVLLALLFVVIRSVDMCPLQTRFPQNRKAATKSR